MLRKLILLHLALAAMAFARPDSGIPSFDTHSLAAYSLFPFSRQPAGPAGDAPAAGTVTKK